MTGSRQIRQHPLFVVVCGLLLATLHSGSNSNNHHSSLVVLANDIDYGSIYLGNKQLRKRMEQWNLNPEEAARNFGDIRHWDLQNVTSLRNVFSFNEAFNEDISGWNVSGVTDFSSLFWTASKFDGNLGSWDVSRAETMACMFCGAKKYTGQGLEEWHDKLGNVQDMFNMFEDTAIGMGTKERPAVDLSSWQVASVTNMRQMFMDTPHYQQTLCWNVSVLARVNDMFQNSGGAGLDPDCVVDHILEDSASAGVATHVWSWWIAAGLILLAMASSCL